MWVCVWVLCKPHGRNVSTILLLGTRPGSRTQILHFPTVVYRLWLHWIWSGACWGNKCRTECELPQQQPCTQATGASGPDWLRRANFEKSCRALDHSVTTAGCERSTWSWWVLFGKLVQHEPHEAMPTVKEHQPQETFSHYSTPAGDGSWFHSASWPLGWWLPSEMGQEPVHYCDHLKLLWTKQWSFC